MIPRTKKQDGFTLIETLLSMSFISFILLFVVFAILEVMGTYNKGLAVKEINQTARTVMEEMSRLVRSTNTKAINNTAINDGRLCLDGISYVWNVKSASTNKYTDNTRVSFARIEDTAGVLCSPPYINVNKDKATELISSQVWVQNVQVALSPNKKLVRFGVRLSTSGSNEPTGNDPTLGPICEGGKIGNYCAVAYFVTTVSARNGEE